jgi:D-alanyl-D-alanine carboxypeptidase/D-alanyl-D-alanine-endopeptidase (penicillin-binding protein 4)
VDAIAWGENEIPVNRAVDDPALHAAAALRDALLLQGVEVTGSLRAVTERRSWQERLAVIPSPFVSQLLATVLKNSHNLYAEMLLKRITGSYEESFARERELLTGDLSLADGTFRFVDGSGLAPDDLMTSAAAIGVLRWMDDPLRRGYWWSTLARPGEEGTLRRRLAGLEDRLAGKTGTINGVAALSGILAMTDGSRRYFSIVVNHHTGDGDAAVAIIDEIVRLAADEAESP